MKRIIVFFFIGAAAVLLLVNFSCSKSSGGGNGNNVGYGQDSSILQNIGYNIIIPSYQSLATAVNSLDSSITDFNVSPNSTKLSNMQLLFKSAYVAWQSASQYDGSVGLATSPFGPASDGQIILSNLNIFPTTTSLIESNISSNNNNVTAIGNTSAKGFPALDYLLFGTDNATLLVDYTTDPKAGNRKQYLAAVSADIKTEVNAVLNGWLASGGNYINTFVKGAGNSVSSSLGLLLNSVNIDFELLKNNRLGIPLGKIPVGSSLPVDTAEVEALYSGISARLALAQLQAVQGLYLGTGAQGNGLGLNNYLVQVNAKYNGGLLSDTVKAAFTLAISDMQAVQDPLSATIQTGPGFTAAVRAFAECQQLVALLKVDIPSALGVTVSYGDNDGD